MDIHLSSTLTPDDESAVAEAILEALSSILDVLPIRYSLRVNSSDGRKLTSSNDSQKTSVIRGMPILAPTGHYDS